MIRLFIFSTFLAFSFLFGATTVEKIKDSEQGLKVTSNQKKQTSRKLEKIAEDIKKAENDISLLEKKIDQLKADEDKTEKAYTQLKSELTEAEKELDQINIDIKKKREAFLSLATEQFSVIFALQQLKTQTRESVISYEVYKAYEKHNNEELASLKTDIIGLEKTQQNKSALRDQTKKSLSGIISKREDFVQKKKEKEAYVKRLVDDEEKYQKKFDQIVDKQNVLRDTLAQLNILHKQEADEAKRAAEVRKEAIRLEKERKRKVRLAQEQQREAQLAVMKAQTKEAKVAAALAAKEAETSRLAAEKQSETVRKVNSSYQKSETYNYRGSKTISPISGAKVVKAFGTYVDPIYKIKIYNESITLQAPQQDAKVQNVLNGQIVYAGSSSMLGKVVVVAHSGKLHTVYAGLSKIAPNITKGRKIKKGYVVGKVNSKLIFQATKNSKHIDPLRLINI
ncbi:peptidoglycan DD-metalloendopeptidase family protein [Sulfurovum sp. zt1-1]|uniref:Peptidoglycan DD-metalloendopeptidase family protein n=1 Tax=Sulfurovum zhangzhouensis TaxID=3019067 RepID=A0ABT7QW59_9BACT|nr:peptidoglycan DD-metalloendopeptidase family protein [Sulfurovum zhangzhouensis]MDM5271069.1 peptidoglycan DD-metalloendopeptidase family protein [Sulfurovum zhangzhouensis]